METMTLEQFYREGGTVIDKRRTRTWVAVGSTIAGLVLGAGVALHGGHDTAKKPDNVKNEIPAAAAVSIEAESGEAKEYVPDDIETFVIANVEINGLMPATWQLPTANITDPNMVPTRFEGSFAITAKIPATIQLLDKGATAKSGVPTFDIDMSKIEIDTTFDGNGMKNGRAGFALEDAVAALRQIDPAATEDDANRLMSEFDSQEGVVDAFNRYATYTYLNERYGLALTDEILKSSVEQLYSAAAEQGVTTNQVVFVLDQPDTKNPTYLHEALPSQSPNVTIDLDNYRANIRVTRANSEQIGQGE